MKLQKADQRLQKNEITDKLIPFLSFELCLLHNSLTKYLSCQQMKCFCKMIMSHADLPWGHWWLRAVTNRWLLSRTLVSVLCLKLSLPYIRHLCSPSFWHSAKRLKLKRLQEWYCLKETKHRAVKALFKRRNWHCLSSLFSRYFQFSAYDIWDLFPLLRHH